MAFAGLFWTDIKIVTETKYKNLISQLSVKYKEEEYEYEEIVICYGVIWLIAKSNIKFYCWQTKKKKFNLAKHKIVDELSPKSSVMRLQIIRILWSRSCEEITQRKILKYPRSLSFFITPKKNGFRFAARQKRNPHLNPGDRKTHDCRKKTLTKLFGQRKLRINLVNVNFELHQLRF